MGFGAPSFGNGNVKRALDSPLKKNIQPIFCVYALVEKIICHLNVDRTFIFAGEQFNFP
jgi:hypothetical protein